jgi:phosphoribosyl-ATP pyrophosphohydrolase/phosphoribosyl-AMP cyclohydrolase
MLSNLNFDENGLIPAVVQDEDTGDVLMLGYMNAESLRRTLAEKEVWFYSRGRQELWHKGATSGNKLKVRSIWVNCEDNSLLVKARPTGPTCHTGHKSCYFRELDKDIPEKS